MCTQRGQASILIALIFQVLFIFFAMVINVGLLIHDKINLQNSVDIAAYYGAMKQAEVLNAMAHVNYQIRQSWKLLNWRLWSLSDAGRNRAFNNYLNNVGAGGIADAPAQWTGGRSGGSSQTYNGPVVCVQNPFWWENHFRRQGGAVTQRSADERRQNKCKDSAINVSLRPINLIGVQRFPGIAQMFGPFQRSSVIAARRFSDSCRDSGKVNFIMATRLLVSYKMAAFNRRYAMQRLQNLLVQSGTQNFRDLSGSSVRDTVKLTFENNLTLPNRSAIGKFEFSHSLREPFLTPIEVRAYLKYLDMYGDNNAGSCQGTLKDIYEAPREAQPTDQLIQAYIALAQALSMPDYAPVLSTTAQAFAVEPAGNQFIKSLVGFEKNPWMLAYVHVKASTRPKMLFAPFIGGGVELQAEAYAMPFGGKIGPWYYKQWLPGSGTSSGQRGADSVDPLLPPRMGDPAAMSGLARPDPNYSRFPGDTLGAGSQLYRSAGLFAIFRGGPREYPQFEFDDYANIEPGRDLNMDPVVYNTTNPNKLIRKAELAALAPDLFDAVYYSIQPNFSNYVSLHGGQFFPQSICSLTNANNNFQCFDYGSKKLNANTFDPSNITEQMSLNRPGNPVIQDAFWLLRPGTDVDPLMTSWGQDPQKSDDFTSTEWIARPVEKGGRTGYSVKIVSKRFLQRGDLPLGGDGGSPGSIKNPPQ